MLGGIGHAVVSAIEEAIFFHSIARQSQPLFELKGSNPLTENYSVLRPEVLENERGEAIARENLLFLEQSLAFDRVIIAGQAKSHCVAWTVEDLWTRANARDPDFVKKIVLLEDCSSPVVVPGAIDFTETADTAYRRFAAAGMTVIRSKEFAIESAKIG
jgi:nicotinamidase-related amidase